jgi:hypothetical protein
MTMPKPPPDRGGHPGRQVGRDAPQPLSVVRGGAICEPNERGGHVMKGSMHAAVCMPTVGADPRPRYREAGKAVTPHSRHSTHALQHRKGGKPMGR